MSSLLHPVHSVSQKCRPKHQVLVLKCYPKYQKTVQEVKPNASELSYLLYYASTRRQKLAKVGEFLEKKNASDVWKGRLGNVHITLQILTSIIEKAPRDLSLYARHVLTILDSVLRSKDVNMVEETVPLFEAYCKYVDAASLTADQQRFQQYVAIVQLYTAFADKTQAALTKAGDPIPLSLKWRTIGLKAIRAAVGSDALATESAKQLSMIIPVLLDNMSLEQDNVLRHLQERAHTRERLDNDVARRRRMSIATVTTVDTVEGDPATAVETTAGADKVAEEEVRALALRSLKQIFSVGISSSRGQTRLATALTLKFIAAKKPPKLPLEGRSQGTWATSLFEQIARWTPVQDRFIILMTAMETLIRTPVVESVLEKQLVLAILIDWLLSSSVNLIGLSVMDILLGLIQHTLLLLQLGGPNPKATVPPSVDTAGFYREASKAFDPSTVLGGTELSRASSKGELTASPVRQELLARLLKCIASLSHHIYYTDQISDMLTAILARLKPSPQSEVPTPAAAINDPAAATKAIAESASIHEDTTTAAFFSFATARVTAMEVIRDIMIRANSRRSATGALIEARARVGIQVWEGTQWLLKDEDRAVRLAYVHALLTWLKLETSKTDLLLPRDGPRKASKKQPPQQLAELAVAKRAVSNASRKESKPARTTFLQLLHLAAYDGILDEPENEQNLLLLYLLLTKLVERLGVNAIRSGLPMIMKLQETALNGEVVSPGGRVNVASVVHGYLWTIAEKFDFEMNPVGHEINGEILRRKKFGIWCDKIKFPAMPIEDIASMPATTEKVPEYADEAVESLRPFLAASDLVNEVATSYDNSLQTPPSSPPMSPGRVYSVPTLSFGYGFSTAPGPKPSKETELPQKVKDEMCATWSRETCIAAVEKESAASMTGSRTGASSLPQHHLNVNGARKPSGLSGRESPAVANGSTTPTFGLMSGLGALTRAGGSSVDGSRARITTSSRDSMIRVTDLKRALSGYAPAPRRHSPLRRPTTGSRRSSATSSMVSWDDTDDRNPSFLDIQQSGATGDATANGTEKNEPRPPTAGSTQSAKAGPGTFNEKISSKNRLNDGVPPVPKIPSNLNLPGTWPRENSPSRAQESPVSTERSAGEAFTRTADPRRVASAPRPATAPNHGQQGTKRSARPVSRKSAAAFPDPVEKFDLGSLLAAIEPKSGVADMDKENRASRLIQPPY